MSRLLWSFLFLAVIMMVDQTEGWRRRRRRRFRCPVTNCAVDNWTTWSSCTQPCGTGGTQRRQRKVTQPPRCGGSCSYALVDSQPCNVGCSNGGTPLPGRCNCKTGYSGRCCTGGKYNLYLVLIFVHSLVPNFILFFFQKFVPEFVLS